MAKLSVVTAVAAPAAPASLVIPRCIGCGAMGRPSSCPGGCREFKLEVVEAAADEELIALRRRARETAERLRQPLEALAAAPLGPAEFLVIQGQARMLLRSTPAPPEEPEAAEPIPTWWCPECGGIDAPQPCLGVCIWRPAGWVSLARYEQSRAAARQALAQERRLRAMVRELVAVAPLPGRWEQNVVALRARARAVLDAPADVD